MMNKQSYRIPLAVFFAAPTIQTIALFFFPESPRWLMSQGREAEAEASLRKLRNKNIKESEFQAEFNEIRISTREQAEHNSKQLWIEMWKGTNRRRTLLSIAVICFHCANGSSWLNIYTTYFLDVAGIENAFAYSTMVTCMGLLGVLISFLFIRSVDRRVVMLVGIAACGFAQLAFAVAWSAAPGTAVAGRVVVAFICLFTFSYVAYGKSATYALKNSSANQCSTLCMASWRRIPEQPSSSTHFWTRDRYELLGQLAWCLHRPILHQSCKPGVEG